MKLLVIYGGTGLSREAAVSELSGRQVIEAAKVAGLDVAEFLLTKDNLEELQSQLKNYDVIFPVLHGQFGEDGGIQTMLEKSGVQYIGSAAAASQLCFDKPSTQIRLKEAGIVIPDFHLISSVEQFNPDWLPCVIKPPQGGSSVDTFIWKAVDLDQLAQLLDQYGALMVEQFIQGRELTVGILGNDTLPIVEIIPPDGGWFDYDNKYSGKSQEIVNPPLSTEISQLVQSIALTAHQTCGCRHLSRVDFILRDNQPYCLEINTLPGFTSESLFPKAAKAAGYDLPALVKKLIELAL